MSQVWDQSRLEKYITDGIEENLTLDYKAAGSLGKSDGKKREITKDVSAMANSAGGIIIYGISEFQDKDHEHLPEKLDPVDRTDFSKEWLEHIIANIQPKIDNVIIHPVSINSTPNHVVYVVEIPQSHTAHQAKDMRYYKRFNFESVMMSDFEIRDVMARGQYPRIELQFELEITEEEVTRGGGPPLGDGMRIRIPGATYEPERIGIANHFKLKIWAFNSGKIYAQFVNVILEIPDSLLPIEPEDEEILLMMGGKRETFELGGVAYHRHFDDNTTRDIIGFDKIGFGLSPNYGPARHVPILPGRYYGLEEDIDLRSDFDELSLDNLQINWEIFADNAPVFQGKTPVSDIKRVDKRTSSD